MGRRNARHSTVRPAPKRSSRAKELPMMRSASSFSPLPRWMEHRGAPPMPHRLAKAMRMEMMGRHRPSPVRARWPGRRPRYIRSTTLYRMLMSWATVMGRAMWTILRAIPPLEKSFCPGFAVIAPPLRFLHTLFRIVRHFFPLCKAGAGCTDRG